MIVDSKRFAAAEKLLQEVDCIARNPAVVSSLPQIGLLLAFLKEIGMEVSVPEEEWAIFGKDPRYPHFSSFSKEKPDKASILFYPMFLSDARIDRVCEYYTKAVQYASYGPIHNCIIVNMDGQETLRMLACAFLHELGHAQAAHCEGRIFKECPRSDEQRLHEETAVWTMEYKLMIALGGHEYLAFVADFVKEICRCWQGLRPDIPWERKGRALDCCLGASPSPDAGKERDVTFLGYCQLMAADVFFPEGKRIAAKIEIMKGAIGRYQQGRALLESFAGRTR